MVPGDEFLAIESTEIWIVPSMTLPVSLYVVPGNETFTLQSTVIWIHVFLQVVAEFYYTATESKIVCNT